MANEKMDAILTAVSQRVGKLIPFGRGYAVLFDPRRKELSFFPFPGAEQPNWNLRSLSTEPMLPDLVISGAKNIRYEKDLASRLAADKIRYWPAEDVKVNERRRAEGNKIPYSWLGVPMIAGDDVVGALVVESWQTTYSFSKDDESTLSTVARQAAVAIENAHLYDQLELKVIKLRILNDVGKRLASGLVKTENKILDLVIESATELKLDTRNMYIAFYTPDPNKKDTADEIYGMIQIGQARNPEQRSPMVGRAAQKGLTEYVIRTRKSFFPSDVQKAYEDFAPDSLRKSRSARALSWLGVPLLSDEGQVFGVIVLRNYEAKNIYTEDDQEILEILAGQIAIALQNLRSSQAEKTAQEQAKANENIAIMSSVAAEFAHKMNNLAGTIPVRVGMAKDLLYKENSREKVFEILTMIGNEAKDLLAAAQKIRQSSEPAVEEDLVVNDILDIAIARAKDSQQNMVNKVNVIKMDVQEGLFVHAGRNSLLDTLTSIIKNGMEAIEEQGTVTIDARSSVLGDKSAVEIRVSDTGKGIPQSEMPKIFDLFYTTKGAKGLGFGLWRDRIFVKQMGGELDVQSEEKRGSTFSIKLPAKQGT